jgi:hypothetical protein
VAITPAHATHTFLTGDLATYLSNQNAFPAVALHPTDDSFVAAYELDGTVFVDQWDGTAWVSLTDFTAADVVTDNFGDGLHIVFDPDGNLHVTFTAYAGSLSPAAVREVYYGMYTAVTMTWSFEQVEMYSNSNGHVNPDYPRISWNPNTNSPELLWTVSNVSSGISPSPNHSLNFAVRAVGSPWAIETVHQAEGPGSILNNAVFTIAADGIAHVSFMTRPPHDGMLPTMLMNDSLMHGNNSTGPFVFMPIVTGDATMMPGKANAIDLNSSGAVHIAYYDYLNDSLRHITNASGAFVDEVVDSEAGADVGRRCIIDVNTANQILIAYQNHTNGTLKTALLQNGDPWDIHTVSNGMVQNARFVGAAFNSMSEAMVVHDTKFAEMDKALSHAYMGPCPGLNAPAGVQASDGTSNTVVRITWDAVPDAASYRIYRNDLEDPDSAQLIGTTELTQFDDGTASPPSFGVIARTGLSGNMNRFQGSWYMSALVFLIALLSVYAFVSWRRATTVEPQQTKYSLTRVVARGGIAMLVLVATVQVSSGCIPSPPEIQPHYYWVKAVNVCGVTSDFGAFDVGHIGLSKQIDPTAHAGVMP